MKTRLGAILLSLLGAWFFTLAGHTLIAQADHTFHPDTPDRILTLNKPTRSVNHLIEQVVITDSTTSAIPPLTPTGYIFVGQFSPFGTPRSIDSYWPLSATIDDQTMGTTTFAFWARKHSISFSPTVSLLVNGHDVDQVQVTNDDYDWITFTFPTRYLDEPNNTIEIWNVDPNSNIVVASGGPGIDDVGQQNGVYIRNNGGTTPDFGPAYGNIYAQLTVQIGPPPGLNIIKSGPMWMTSSEPITYHLRVVNNTAVPLTNILITDTLPTGANYISGGTLVGNIVSWTISSLGVDSSTSVNLVVTASQTITNNNYRVSSSQGYSMTSNFEVVTLVSGNFCDLVNQIPQSECQALQSLFNSTNGPGWLNDNAWLETNKPCYWYGIDCGAGQVVNLHLFNNQLSGTIPATLGGLSNLQRLMLYNNSLTGTIPTELGNLTNLTDLSLGVNQLTGSIPVQFGNMTALQTLDLANNQLSGPIPSQLGNLSNLQAFWAYSNDLSGPLPPELGDLSQLTNLSLSSNDLTGPIPPELGNLSSMVFLSLQVNNITGTIPSELGNLTSTLFFELDNNQLTGPIPPELSNLSSLLRLTLSNNQLSGPIPPQLGNLGNLQVLALGNNRLTGTIPGQIGNLTSLWSLDFDNNALGGEVPSTITNLVSLISLDLSFNKLSASDPAVIAFLATNDPGWDLTQTVPPTNLQAMALITPAVALNWTPIDYTLHSGYYEISLALTPTGPFTIHGTTADKSAASYVAANLLPGTIYYWRVRTHTIAHPNQQNPLFSEYTAVISITTPTTNSAQTTAAPGMSSTLVYTGSNGNPTLIDIPTGAVSQTITLLYTPVPTPTPPTNYNFAGQAFRLNAYQNGILLPDYTFQQPVTVTIYYQDSDIQGLDEAELALMYWDSNLGQWQDVVNSCTPPSTYQRDTGANRLSVPICHLSDFALFAPVQDSYELYMPAMLRP